MGDVDLTSVLNEVHCLRVQLERCISSNDQLRRTLQKSGKFSAEDGNVQTTRPRDDDGKQVLLSTFFLSVLCLLTYIFKFTRQDVYTDTQ